MAIRKNRKPMNPELARPVEGSKFKIPLPFLNSNGPATEPKRRIQQWELLSLGYHGRDVAQTQCSEDQLKAALRRPRTPTDVNDEFDGELDELAANQQGISVAQFIEQEWNGRVWGGEAREEWSRIVRQKGFFWVDADSLKLNGKHALVKVWCTVWRPGMYFERTQNTVVLKWLDVGPDNSLVSWKPGEHSEHVKLKKALRYIWHGKWLGWKEAYSWLLPKQVEFWMCLKCSMEARAVWSGSIAWRSQTEDFLAHKHWGLLDRLPVQWGLGTTGQFRIPETDLDVITFDALESGRKHGPGVDSYPVLKVVDNGDVKGDQTAVRRDDQYYSEYQVQPPHSWSYVNQDGVSTGGIRQMRITPLDEDGKPTGNPVVLDAPKLPERLPGTDAEPRAPRGRGCQYVFGAECQHPECNKRADWGQGPEGIDPLDVDPKPRHGKDDPTQGEVIGDLQEPKRESDETG